MRLSLMSCYSALALFCSLTGFLPAATLAAPVQSLVPPDSFIAQHVGTVSELHQQITLDPVVRRRLARHFHASAPTVTRYIQDNLVLTKLKKAGRYQVYCVGRSGQEYSIKSRLAAGTPVFVLRSTGQPVLKLACGNPMIASLPPAVTKVASHHALMLVSPMLSPSSAAAPALSANGPVVVAMADTPGVVVMPTTKVAGFIGQLPISHGGLPFGYLAAIPVLAIAGSHHGGGSSPSLGTTRTTGTNTIGTSPIENDTTSTNTSGTNTLGTNTSGTNTSVTPVPEPSTLAAFAVGGVALLYLLGSSKRRRSKIVF